MNTFWQCLIGVSLIWLVGGCSFGGKAGSQPAVVGLNAGLPGKQAGTAQVACRGSSIELRNELLAARFEVGPSGFKWHSLQDRQNNSQVLVTGEVFQVLLGNGQRYAASSLVPEAAPRVSKLTPKPEASRLAERIAGKQVEVPLRTSDGRLRVVWRAVLRDGGNYVRQELDLMPFGGEARSLKEILWFEQHLPGSKRAGEVDGSPVIAGDFFMGAEDPHALNAVEAECIRCGAPRGVSLNPGETRSQSFVVGLAPPGQMRRGFLYYVERERAHPYRPFLHYNSWYDIAWHPFALNETNCLEAIRLCGENLVKRHGVVVDAMVFDDGWDNPQTMWQFHRGFPQGFSPLATLCKDYNTRLGVWLSPFGGYGEPKKQRLKMGTAQGYETNATGFSLAGPKYYVAFKAACVEMIRKYGVNHFKFDGIAAGMSARGAADYFRDTEAMRRLMVELRKEEPALYINLTTGSWPSPFWLRYADSLWRQGGDMGLAGAGPKKQQWLTYRDQEVYRNIVRRGPLYPLNALMTQGVAYSREGSAGEPTFNSAGFKDDVRAFFGSGTSLQELYIQPGKLTPADWAVLAEAAKWSRTNAEVLVDTHWIGGDPGKLEVYGYASWCPRKGIVMLRNPSNAHGEFFLDVEKAFELPASTARIYRLRSPWVEDAKKPELMAKAGEPLRFVLKPFEVLILEATPIASK